VVDEPALIFVKRRFIQRSQCDHSQCEALVTKPTLDTASFDEELGHAATAELIKIR